MLAAPDTSASRTWTTHDADVEGARAAARRDGIPGTSSPAAAVTSSGSFGFPAFTEAEKRRLRELQADDTIGMIQRDWGRGVLSHPPAERPVLIMLQLQILEGMWADPREWVRRALELAGGDDSGQ